MGKQHRRSSGGTNGGEAKKAKKKGSGGFFSRLADVGNDVMNDVVNGAKKAGEVMENAGTSLLDSVKADDEMSNEEILNMTSAIPNQDIIYEQLALAAYGKWSEASLAEWGYEVLTEYEDPSSGLRLMAFAPVDYDFSKWPALADELKKQHGGMDRRPVVSFRGTAEKGGVMDDLNEGGIGTYQFSSNEGDIQGVLNQAAAFGKIDVTGHSLGGALAQLCGARYPGMMGRIVTFQSPGINKEDAQRIKDHNKAAAPEDQIHSTHHRNSEDLVHLGGEALTDGVVYTFDKDGDNTINAHTGQLLSELNDMRGGVVARTYGGGAYDKKKDGSRPELKKNARLEKNTIEGVSVQSSGKGKDGFKHEASESLRHGFGTMVDNTVGAFSAKTDSRDDYVQAWATVQEMYKTGAPLREINDFIVDTEDLLPEQRLRMANQASKLYA